MWQDSGSGASAGDGGTSIAAVMPWKRLCDDVLTAYRAQQDIVVLQRFEELQAMPELDSLLELSCEDRATRGGAPVRTPMNGITGGETTVRKKNDVHMDELENVEFCWGRAVLAAKRLAGDDDEHVASIVEAFEERFGRPSEYLRVLAITADSALEALKLRQLEEGSFTASAVRAALHKFPSLAAEETRELLEFLRLNRVSLTSDLSEQLEKHFVMRMKTEDAEDVFHEMCSAGVEPMSTRPYNLVFMKSTPFKYMSPVEYYLDMLDRGITPENSTFRILSKQTRNDGFTNQHFSSLAWGNSTSNHSRDEDERGGTQIFFALCLKQLAESKPETTLEEAMRVFHRMDVEGTPLTDGSPVVTTLLTHFCRHDHLEDAERVLQVSLERGSKPTHLTLQKLLQSNDPERFDLAELVLQKIVEAGELIRVDCVDLLRHFVEEKIRNKAVRVLRAFVIQWYMHPNERIPFPIASMAIRLGPFDWALGVLAILLVTTERPLGKSVPTRIRDSARDIRSRELLAVLEKCEWKRECLFAAAEFQEPDSDKGNGGASIGGAASVNAKNHHRLDRTPSWLGVMHIALQEMSVEPEVMDAYKKALLSAIEKSKEQIQ